MPSDIVSLWRNPLHPFYCKRVFLRLQRTWHWRAINNNENSSNNYVNRTVHLLFQLH